jgi:LysM repeat protein
MALTEKQKAAIKSQAKKNAAKRAATQRTKVSASEARTVSSKMNKRPGAMPSFTLKDRSILSKNERNTLGATSKANADKERMIQKHRKFAKGEGKLPIKERVGTKAEYKQLGKDIETRKQLIARSKAARAAQAARGTTSAPANTTTLTKAETPMPAKKKATTSKPKASTTAIKKRTTRNASPKTSKPKVAGGKKLQTLDEAKAKAPTPKTSTKPRLQTLEQAKASAPKPRGPMLGPEKPTTTLTKPVSKVASKVDSAKKAASSTRVGSTLKKAANTTAGKSVASKVSSAGSKLAKNKLVKVGGKLVKVGAVIGIGREVAQIVSGQAEKDFLRIQALENRVALAKGQKPKYTTTGTNRNLGESLKVDAGNALSWFGAGTSRKARIKELQAMAAKAEKKSAAKPGVKTAANSTANTPKSGGAPANAPASGSKYLVQKGDTLSAIASRSGVSLKDIRDANPKFATQAKYKNGNMIFSGTSVTIPKKKAK